MFAIRFRRDDRRPSPVPELVDKHIGIIRLISDDGARVDIFEKSSAQAETWSCPGVSIKARGSPDASLSTWILMLGPVSFRAPALCW